MKIYIPNVVQQIQSYYGDLVIPTNFPKMIGKHLSLLAAKLWSGMELKPDFLLQEINNYHPKYLGIPIEELRQQNLTFEDCQITIANSFGFQSRQEVESLVNVSYNESFEIAIHHLLNGNLPALSVSLEKEPHLIHQQSQLGHKATLLHYAGSNGVEMWRQQVPYNLVEIVAYLIEKGADINAKMLVYGGAFTTYELLTTSAHPYEAGIGKELERLLERG